MAEYIEREAAIAAVRHAWSKNLEPTQFIDEIPAADVAEVRHGRWIWDSDGYCRCSECTQKAPVMPQYQDEPITTMTKYCPHCGVRMDGGAENG